MKKLLETFIGWFFLPCLTILWQVLTVNYILVQRLGSVLCSGSEIKVRFAVDGPLLKSVTPLESPFKKAPIFSFCIQNSISSIYDCTKDIVDTENTPLRPL